MTFAIQPTEYTAADLAAAADRLRREQAAAADADSPYRRPAPDRAAAGADQLHHDLAVVVTWFLRVWPATAGGGS